MRLIGGGFFQDRYFNDIRWMGAEQLNRIIHSETIHELIGIWGNPGLGERYIKSDVIHSMSEKQVWTEVGQWADIRDLSESISVEVIGSVA